VRTAHNADPVERAAATGARLRCGAASLGIDLEPSQISSLTTFVDLLETWNARLNLVGQHERAILVDRHVVDALAGVPVAKEIGPELRVVDVGSGAGLPGIPFAIASGTREIVLVEPRRKRASFLRAARRVLPTLPISVVEARAAEAAALDGGAYDAVISRAALRDGELMRVAARWLRPGGLLIAYRGVASAELERSAVAATGPGFSSPRFVRYQLEGMARSFTLIVRERTRFT
jgi:16S rRNA (guanine527-N7)-methyltransferase